LKANTLYLYVSGSGRLKRRCVWLVTAVQHQCFAERFEIEAGTSASNPHQCAGTWQRLLQYGYLYISGR
ncbi:hypothetical protein CSUI_007098, partial [Cystoisospora suis]